MNDDCDSLKNFDEQRLQTLIRQQQYALYRQTDRMFAWLMGLQWLGGVAVALLVSPRTWIGDASAVHAHVWAAVLLGGLISSLPIALAILLPGRTVTRHVIAFAQMSWSGLLIHLSGGRIETHFHVFGSLAFLAFYFDWRVLLTATLVTAVDHFVRGVWWPYSVFGVFVESPHRWIEHAGWVIFEDVFLIVSCQRGGRALRESCRRRAILEATNARIETQVELRTAEYRMEKQRTEMANHILTKRTAALTAVNARLAQEIEERKKAEAARAELHEQLVASSRIAGMAEVATGVLHNVGNVLNSVNVSASLLMDRTQASPVSSLVKAADVITRRKDELGTFLTTDPRGKHFPRLLSELAAGLSAHQQEQIAELRGLMEHIEHVKEIINMQQSLARVQSVAAPVDVVHLVNEALKINDAGLSRHGVRVEREFADVPLVCTDKHKVLQILVNLISNAKNALHDAGRDDKRMVLTVAGDEAHVSIQVRDNGVGISRENLTRIFSHGFTTRKEGHGFGLHSAALAAQELEGSLSVHSDGAGLGATFTLHLPVQMEALSASERPSATAVST